MFRSGLQSMLKEGTRHFSGVDEAILRNIEAVKKLTTILKTSYGPFGANKLIINHLDKLFVTADAATILKELEVIHPAAKLLVMAAEAQQSEIGDNTNWVVIFAGELLIEAENLLRMGLHPSDILQGYTKGGEKALAFLEDLAVAKCEDIRNEEHVTSALKTSLSGKQYGYEDLLTPIVARACVQVCPQNPKNFNVDNVRVIKIEGGSVHDTSLMKGLVINRKVETSTKHARQAKVAVFGCPVDVPSTEGKGNVLIKNAEQLINYSKSEELVVEKAIQELADAGVTVVVTGQNFGELAIHYMERHKMMGIKITSKFELRRVCQAVGATPLVRLGAPTLEEMGHCDYVTVEELGDTPVLIFKQDAEDSRIATIVVRGSTQNIMDDVERAVDDAVNVYKCLCRDNRLVAGAGALELELALRMEKYAESTPGLDQYALRRYAQALEIFPRILAETAGQDATQVISKLHAAHKQGKQTMGVNVEGSDIIDAKVSGFLDSWLARYWAIKFATEAAVSVLKVDQIIMAKMAGGPKPPQQGGRDDED